MIAWLAEHYRKMDAAFSRAGARAGSAHEAGGRRLMAWNSESDLEDWMMEKLAGWAMPTASGAEISPEKRDPERRSFHDAILRKIFTKAVAAPESGAAGRRGAARWWPGSRMRSSPAT